MPLVSFAPVMQPLSSLATQQNNVRQNTPTQNTAANNLAADDNVTCFAGHTKLNQSKEGSFFSKFTTQMPRQNNTSGNTADLLNQLAALTQQLATHINQNGQTSQNCNTVQGNAGNTQQNTQQNTQTTTTGSTTTGTTQDLSTIVSLNTADQNLQKWQQNANSGNYSYTLTQRTGSNNLDASRPINVTVSNGNVSNANYSDNTALNTARNTIPTIESLFNTIKAAQTNGERTDAIYNRDKGFPEFIFIGNNNNPNASSTSYIISNVTIRS